MSHTDARRLLLQMMGAVTTSNSSSNMRVTASTTLSLSAQDNVTASQPVSGSARKSSFSKFAAPQTVSNDTEDALYCNSPTESDVQPEVYWAKMSSTNTYPRLAKLARTLLSIPASSGSVERLFSVSGAIVRARRSRLAAPTVESVLLAMEYKDSDTGNDNAI